MTKAVIQIARIRYNLEFSGYEAIVFIEDAGEPFSYPCFVSAPLDADYKFIMRQLEAKTLESHASANPGLRSRLRRPAPSPRAPVFPPLAA
ncbi:hypothetical protein DZK27_04255 [Rhodobacteraceae bacterium 63075]|nr:hypothetical protein DZK27_04255 [Rhodobacteraceae bacterium 63075]